MHIYKTFCTTQMKRKKNIHNNEKWAKQKEFPQNEHTIDLACAIHSSSSAVCFFSAAAYSHVCQNEQQSALSSLLFQASWIEAERVSEWMSERMKKKMTKEWTTERTLKNAFNRISNQVIFYADCSILDGSTSPCENESIAVLAAFGQTADFRMLHSFFIACFGFYFIRKCDAYNENAYEIG